MTKPRKPNFSPEFRLETAQLVVDNGYTQIHMAIPDNPKYEPPRQWLG